MTHVYTAAVTLLVLLLYMVLTIQVSMARGKYRVLAPATTGDEMFERIYRVHMNTLEQMVFLLPAMWLYAFAMTDVGAAVGGLIWIAGRVIYAVTYVGNPRSRSAGYAIALVGAVGLYVGAAYGVLRVLL